LTRLYSVNRRGFLRAAGTLLAGAALPAWAQSRIPIADMHSHYGMFSRFMPRSGLAEEMRAQGVALVAWKHVADSRWIRSGPGGIEQSSKPSPGQLAFHFNSGIRRMKDYIADQKLRLVLTSADVEACIAGEAGIVLASEGADFLEGKLDGLDAAYAAGLRHLQFVHYIHSPVGDFQTAEPEHQGLSAFGRELVAACNARGILVDLAHSSGDSVDQALAVAKAPLIWSHSWVDAEGGSWKDRFGFEKRRLSMAHARKIADGGGVVGLWGLGLSRPTPGWPVARGDTRAYAGELARLANSLGADHVALGTDIEGVGIDWTVNNYTHVREVVGHLESMKLEASVIERIAYRNYARVLRAVLKG
jgi:membrane dipeptidase